MSLEIDESLSLEQLVSLYEEKELNLEQVPQAIVDRYGFACLANALMFKEPEIPKYKTEIKDYIQHHTFKTLNSLITYIKNLDDNIDKLFAIFAYSALNIEYDTKLYFSGKHTSTTLEEVFQTKKAVCSGYSIFFKEMAKRVNIDTNQIVIKEYSNYAKGYSYDATNPPDFAESNHASVHVTINNVPFISEPTWAAGHINNNQEFEWNFQPELFLIPVYKTLCDHYPCKECQQLLPFKFKYHDFVNAIKLEPFGKFIKTESHPFVKYNCSNGYIRQTFSCIGPIDSVSFQICQKKGNIYNEITINGLTSYEIIQTKLPKHPNRCRFRTHVLLPKAGFFLVKMYINHEYALEYYINNSNPCNGSIPIQFNPFHFSRFIAVKPKRILSSVSNGVRVIHFAVPKERYKIKYEIMKLKDANSFNLVGEIVDKKYAQYVSLDLPFESDFVEIQLCVTFPSNGRYSVLISFINDDNKWYKFVRYFFDVSGVNKDNVHSANPIYYVSKGRRFTSIKYFDGNNNEVLLKPSLIYNYVEEREQTLLIKTASIKDSIYFELRRNNDTVEYPKEVKCDEEYRKVKWTFPEENGEYILKCWINDKCCINLPYFFGKIIFNETSQNEIELLEELKEKISNIGLNKITNGEAKKKVTVINQENKIKEKDSKNKCDINNTNKNESIKSTYDNNTIKCTFENINKKENEGNTNEILDNQKIKRENEILRNEIEKLKNEKTNIEKLLKENEERRMLDIEKIKRENEDNKRKVEAEKERIISDINMLKYENDKLNRENEEKKKKIEEEKTIEKNEDQKIDVEKIIRENEILKKENEKLKNEKTLDNVICNNDSNSQNLDSRKSSKCCILI